MVESGLKLWIQAAQIPWSSGSGAMACLTFGDAFGPHQGLVQICARRVPDAV